MKTKVNPSSLNLNQSSLGTPPLKRYQVQLRQRLLNCIIAEYEAQSKAAVSRKHAAVADHDIEAWHQADALEDLAVADRDKAMEALAFFDCLMSAQTKTRLAKTREGLEEGLRLAAERIQLLELWENPDEGETPLQAVAGEIALIDRAVSYESRRTITAGLEAFEEMCESNRGFISRNHCGDSETPELDGIREESIAKPQED